MKYYEFYIYIHTHIYTYIYIYKNYTEALNFWIIYSYKNTLLLSRSIKEKLYTSETYNNHTPFNSIMVKNVYNRNLLGIKADRTLYKSTMEAEGKVSLRFKCKSYTHN